MTNQNLLHESVMCQLALSRYHLKQKHTVYRYYFIFRWDQKKNPPVEMAQSNKKCENRTYKMLCVDVG